MIDRPDASLPPVGLVMTLPASALTICERPMVHDEEMAFDQGKGAAAGKAAPGYADGIESGSN